MNARTCAILLLYTLANMAGAREIEINDDRVFQIDPGTVVTRNGEPASPDDVPGIATGYQTYVELGDDSDLRSGSVVAIDFDDRLVGPITSIDPLAVLSIPIVVTGDTQLLNIPGDDVGNLQVDDIIQVSGYTDLDSSVLASRIELPAGPVSTWRIEGYLANRASSTFDIGSQKINFATAIVSRCPGDVVPATGFVEVEADPASGFGVGNTLVAREVECESDRLPGDGSAVVEGIITALTDPNHFLVGEQPVVTDTSTVYEHGTIEDIDVGVRVEAEGLLDGISGNLLASRVEIREIKVRLEAPVAPGDIVTGESVTIMQNTLIATPQTRDEDGLLAGGIGAATQIEVRGFQDQAGTLYATRIRDRGTPDLNDAEVRGPAVDIAQPNLTILGVAVDTSTSIFLDAARNPITAAEFFAQVTVATSVGVEDAQYDPATNAITGGIVKIEEEDLGLTSKVSKGAIIGGQVIGTVTGLGDVVFADGFE